MMTDDEAKKANDAFNDNLPPAEEPVEELAEETAQEPANEPAEEPAEVSANVPAAEELAAEPASEPDVFLSTYVRPSEDALVCGVTLLGRVHKRFGDKCQDYHLFSDLGDGWHLYLVSDGAGSASSSDRGARWNCITAEYLIKGMLERVDWKSRDRLPTELEWYQEFYAICRKIKETIEERVEMLDEHSTPKDFNATLLVLIVAPHGMLSAHIGDGRMGYRNQQGEWRSLMTPHRGAEANQTIFMMNKWDSIFIPSFRLNGVSVPEVQVCTDIPDAVVVLSDGCENFSWNCLQPDPNTGMLADVNTPFHGFWNPLILSVGDSDESTRLRDFIAFVDSNTDECKDEQDDRSLLVGIYYHAVEDESTDIDEQR